MIFKIKTILREESVLNRFQRRRCDLVLPNKYQFFVIYDFVIYELQTCKERYPLFKVDVYRPKENASGITQRILMIQKLFKELFLFAKSI